MPRLKPELPEPLRFKRLSREPELDLFEEQHYTVKELAAKWKLSPEFVRQIVCNEPGVTEWVRQVTGKRRYRVLRVPKSVAERVHRRATRRVRG